MKKITALFPVMIMVMLCSCVKTLQTVPNNYAGNGTASVIIGEMMLPKSEYLMIGGQFTHNDGGSIAIRDIAAGVDYQIVPRKSKNKKYYFFVSLPRGRYLVTGLKWGQVGGPTEMMFDIAENNSIYYIGTVKITKVETTAGQKAASWFVGNITGARSIPLSYAIIDNNEEVAGAFKTHYPAIKGDVMVSLISLAQ